MAVSALTAVALLAGCGGGSSTSSSAPASPPATGPQLQQAFVRVIHQVAPSVVQVETSAGLGSGIVYDGQGDIVTNNHVVASGNHLRVTASNGKSYDATLVGTFPEGDLAVVRASGADLHPAAFGDSSKLQVGTIVLAIGNPLGLRSSVTDGIVSALGRTVSEPNGRVLPNAIQTSAPINPGNSGGALVDLAGRVVGIPTLAATDPELGGSAAPGIGFAIPSSTVTDIAGQIVQHGHVVNSHRAFLGVRLATSPAVSGAVVVAVEKGSPADKAGMRPGDVIVSIAGHPISSASDATTVLAGLDPGKTVDVVVQRQGGGKQTLRVTLGQFPVSGG